MQKLKNKFEDIQSILLLILLSPVILIMLPIFLLIFCAPLGACNHCGEDIEKDKENNM